MKLEKIGILLTVAYVLGIGTWVRLNWGEFSKLPPNSWGDFLAGSFGPLALAWVVLGFFLQSRELKNSVEALKLQSEELKNSVLQQTRLAETSAQQLQQEREAFLLSLKNQEIARLPKFVLAYSGFEHPEPTTLGENNRNKCIHRFSLANISGTACQVTLWAGYGVLKPDEERVVIWPQFIVRHYTLELFANDDHGDTIQIEISYEDGDGNEYQDQYSFTRTQPLDPNSFVLEPS